MGQKDYDALEKRVNKYFADLKNKQNKFLNILNKIFAVEKSKETTSEDGTNLSATENKAEVSALSPAPPTEVDKSINEDSAIASEDSPPPQFDSPPPQFDSPPPPSLRPPLKSLESNFDSS